MPASEPTHRVYVYVRLMSGGAVARLGAVQRGAVLDIVLTASAMSTKSRPRYFCLAKACRDEMFVRYARAVRSHTHTHGHQHEQRREGIQKIQDVHLESDAVFHDQVLGEKPCPGRRLAGIAAAGMYSVQRSAASQLSPDLFEGDAAAPLAATRLDVKVL